MRTLQFLIILSLIGMSLSCSTGKKALQKGNYSEAVFKAVERLRSNPDSKNARATLKNGYPLAVETLETEINNILQSNDAVKYRIAAEKYQRLNDMAAEIRRSPAAIGIIPHPKSYTQQLSATKDQAAEEAYLNGKQLMEAGSREEAKEAYFAFQSCLEYSPGYKDARKMLDQAYEMATLKVLAEPIPVPGRYKLNSDFFYNDILSRLNNDKSLEFIHFLNAKEADLYPAIDQILIMEFYDFEVGATKEEQKERQVTSPDSVKVGTATINGQNVAVYDRVKATITTFKRTLSSAGVLQVKVLDAYTKKVLEDRKFPGTYIWETSWASFNGDERALSKEEIEQCKRKPASAPSPQDLFYEFTQPIYNQTSGFLRSYYRRY